MHSVNLTKVIEELTNPLFENQPTDSVQPTPVEKPNILRKLYILRAKHSDLHDSDELDQLQQIIDAKQWLNNRKNVIYYINDNELLFMKEHDDTSDKKLYIKLIADVPKRISIHHNRSDKSDKKKDRSSSIQASDKKSYSRSASADGTSQRHGSGGSGQFSKSDGSDLPTKVQSCSQMKSLVTASTPPLTEYFVTKDVILDYYIHNIKYIPSDRKFDIFVIEKTKFPEAAILCRGLKDSQIRSKEVENFRMDNIFYEKLGLHLTIYAQGILFTTPTYVVITSEYTCTVAAFVDMLEDVFSLKKQSTVLIG